MRTSADAEPQKAKMNECFRYDVFDGRASAENQGLPRIISRWVFRMAWRSAFESLGPCVEARGDRPGATARPHASHTGARGAIAPTLGLARLPRRFSAFQNRARDPVPAYARFCRQRLRGGGPRGAHGLTGDRRAH